MKVAVVTGANGFVGGAVLRELISEGYFVYAFVHNRTDNIPDVPNVKVVKFSLSDIASVNEVVDGCQLFFHFAWEGSAGPLRADTSLQLRNVQWTIEALRYAKKIGCEKFIGAGSIVEYETFFATQKGQNRLGTGYIYGSGKLAAHTMAKAVAADIGIDLIWGQITNAYGPGEISPRLVNTSIRKIINGENPSFSSGTQNYDFIYIDDLARGFRMIGEKGVPFSEYMLGSSNAKPLREFLMDMKQSIADDVDFIFGDIPFTGVDLPLSYFSCDSTVNDTGFKAQIDFKEGVRRTRDWIVKQR